MTARIKMLVVLAVVALGCLGGGAALMIRGLHEHSAQQPLPGGVTTTGTIVSVQKYCVRGCTYQPTISYTVDGQVYQVVGSIRNGDPAIGSADRVSYDPTDPSLANDLGGGAARYVTDIILGGAFALIGLLLGLVLATTPRRLRRKAAGQPQGNLS